MRPLLVAALVVVAPLLAGCSSPPPPEEAGEGPPVQLDDGTTLVAGTGLVEGIVRSDVGFALPGARVSLLGTDHYMDTDGEGAFRFANVTAGDIELQVVHQSYQTHVHRLTLDAGTAAFVNITMLARIGPGVETPHTHDMWGGKDTYVLVDDDINLQAPPWDSAYPDPYWNAYNAVVRPNVASPDAARWPIPLTSAPGGGPSLVLPGTDRLTVTLTWSAATVRTEGIGFCYNSAAPGADVYMGVQPASPAKWEVPVNGSMADAGHQPFSLWSLWIYVTPLNGGTGGLPDAMYGTVHAKIELHKGEVVADPPHRDFWAEGNQRSVLTEDRINTNTYSTVPHVYHPEDLVPPGTTRMRIEHRWEVQNQVVAQTGRDYRIFARTASMPPDTDPGRWFAPTPTGGSAASSSYIYEFDVGPLDVDGYYQSKSFWRFAPVQPMWGAGNVEVSGVAVRHILNVTAIRVP